MTLFTARPGLVIGRKGSEIERMSGDISKMCGGREVKIDIYEIKQPELDAQLVAENVALQLERRISFRRAMKRALQTTMDFGAEGIRIRCAGRLGGADIARAEWYREGKVPLQTLRVPIDYGFAEARTVYGIIGVGLDRVMSVMWFRLWYIVQLCPGHTVIISPAINRRQ